MSFGVEIGKTYHVRLGIKFSRPANVANADDDDDDDADDNATHDGNDASSETKESQAIEDPLKYSFQVCWLS